MWLPPLLSVLLLGPMSILGFSFAPPSLPHFNGSTSRSSGLSGSPNWYSSLPLLLTTTAPPNASQVNDNDWLDAPEAEVHSPSPVFSSERSPPSPPREQSHDELCVHDSSSNTLTGHLSSGKNGQNDIRVASNCRSAVKKLDALKFYESSRLRMAQASAPSGSTYSGRNNFTNNFISPHTANVKTSPNGQITVLNGKSVTPILYADERPHLLPQYERWMAPTTAKSYLVTAKPEIANDEAEKKDDDEDEDGAEEGAEDEGGDNEEGNEPAKTEKADNSETDSQVKLEPSSTPNSSPTSTSTPTTSTTTVTATSSESPILPSTSTTRTLPKNRFLTRRPDYFGKSKFGDKLTTDNPEKGSQSGPNLPSNHGQANWSPSLTTRKPVSHLYATSSTTTTSPSPGRSYLVPSSTTSSVPNKMNSQIEALRARYKQANSAGKGNGKATETPSTTAMPKVKVEYTTTTTTTTESVLKFAQNPSQENKDSSQPQEEDNQRHPQSKNHNYLPTEQPPYGYNKASPTDTTKKQIPKPNSGRYREPVSFPPTRPFSSSTSPRPYPYPEPTYIRVEPSPSPPYPVKMSLPQNAYYTPLPNVELNRLPTPTSAYSRPESVPEYTGNHHRQPNEQYQAHPSTPKPEVFVTIENQVYVVRNETPIVEEEIALPQAGNDYYYGPHHHQEQQLHPHNKFNGGDITHNVISYQTYEEDSKKPYKMHQHLATTGHGPPMPLKQAFPTFSSQVLADILKRPSKSQEIPSNDMYFYYDNHSHQPKHNYRVPSANQVYPPPQSSSYSSSSSSTFDEDSLQLTPGIRQHLKSLAHFEDESSPILSHSRGPPAESMRGASPAARHQIKDITLPPSRPSMTVSFGAVSEPTLASYSRVPPSAGRGHSSSSPEQLRSSSSKLQDLYKAIDIAPNRANPIVFGDRNALKSSGSSNQVSSPGLSSSQTDSGSSAKLETIKDIYPMPPSPTKDPHEQTFTLVRHYVRTYGYDDPANTRPTELQFDSKLNVDLKNLNQIGSLTSDLRKSHPSFSSSKYFGMPRQPSFASSPSNEDFPPAPPRYVTKYHPESNRHLSSPTPTHEAYVVRVNIPPTMATNTNSQRYKLHMSDLESMSRPSQLPPPPYHVFSSPSSSKPTKASFSSYFLQNHEPSFASKPNILPVETTIFESKPFHFTSSNNFNKPLLTLDSNLHNSKNSFSHVGPRPQPAHENDIMEEGISESQVRELMKPLLKDPFEDYYSDRILPLNAMLDYSNVFWNAQRQQQAELNRQPAVNPSESQQSNKWMQLPEVKPTVKSKLKDFLSMFNEVTGGASGSSQQNHSSLLASATSVVPIFAEHPTASSRLPERLQPVFEKIQSPERPKNMPSKSLFGKPQAFGQGVNQDLDMSGSAPMATVIARPSTSLSAAPTPAEMFPWFANSLQNQQLLGEIPTTDANRSRRNQRLLKSLKSILGFVGSNPNLSLPAVDPSSAP